MRLLKKHVGRYCTARFDDIGNVDGILVDINTKFKWAEVFLLSDSVLNTVDFNQVVDVRNWVLSDRKVV